MDIDWSEADENFQKAYNLGFAHGGMKLDEMTEKAKFLAQQLYAERQKVKDLQELLDKTRQIAYELDQKVMRGKA